MSVMDLELWQIQNGGLVTPRPSKRETFLTDYEPEQAYGTSHDLREHLRYGGTREDY